MANLLGGFFISLIGEDRTVDRVANRVRVEDDVEMCHKLDLNPVCLLKWCATYVTRLYQPPQKGPIFTFSLSWFCRASAVFTPLSLSVARELWTFSSSSPRTASSASTFESDCTRSAFSDSRVASWAPSTSLDCTEETTRKENDFEAQQQTRDRGG